MLSFYAVLVFAIREKRNGMMEFLSAVEALCCQIVLTRW